MTKYCFKGFLTDCYGSTIKYSVFATKGNNANDKDEDKEVKNALIRYYYEELLREFVGVYDYEKILVSHNMGRR